LSDAAARGPTDGFDEGPGGRVRGADTGVRAAVEVGRVGDGVAGEDVVCVAAAAAAAVAVVAAVATKGSEMDSVGVGGGGNATEGAAEAAAAAAVNRRYARATPAKAPSTSSETATIFVRDHPVCRAADDDDEDDDVVFPRPRVFSSALSVCRSAVATRVDFPERDVVGSGDGGGSCRRRRAL
jgi:hypothetical protein